MTVNQVFGVLVRFSHEANYISNLEEKNRGKPSEQEKRIFRPINEQDAELAVQYIGTILCELGWARWL